MRLVTYSVKGNRRLGLQRGETIVDLQAAYLASGGNPQVARFLLGQDMITFLSAGEVALEAARQAEAYARGNVDGETVDGCPVVMPLAEVVLEAPVPRPGKVICIGLNYKDHAEETGAAVPQEPIIFTKYPSNVIGPNQPVVHPGPELTQKLDYEVELVIVIGKGGRDIPASRAMEHVAGYTVGNDISARDLQIERGGQWVKGKALDTFAPLGPVLVTADEIPDPHNLRLQLRLNGTTMQDSNTRQLIFGVPVLIEFLSRLSTLEPGDVIFTGTPPGVGMARKPPVWLQPGDVMEAEIEKIGVLRNPVVAKGARQ